jgi:hypothetical protein
MIHPPWVRVVLRLEPKRCTLIIVTKPKLTLAFLVSLILSLSLAQSGTGIQHEDIRLEDLTALLGTFHALTIPLPEGTTSVVLASSQPSDGLSAWDIGYSNSSLVPERLRVVIGLPRFQSSNCAEGRLDVVFTVEGGEGSSGGSFCYQPPESTSGYGLYTIGEGRSVELDSWTLLFAYVPYIVDHPNSEPGHAGLFDSEESMLMLLYVGAERPEDDLPWPDLPALRQELNSFD